MIRGAYSVIVWQPQNDRVALAWRSGTRRTGKQVVLANTRGGRQAPILPSGGTDPATRQPPCMIG